MVLTAWQGLGYNRRAKLLHECAQVVHSDYYGRWPRSVSLLEKLPGIGPYTASAVAAFAYNQPAVCVETNIRTTVIYHYFPKETEISEAAIRDVIGATLDTQHPREWYWALMDYGAHLKRTRGNFNRQARSYTKQSRFTGSDRGDTRCNNTITHYAARCVAATACTSWFFRKACSRTAASFKRRRVY